MFQCLKEALHHGIVIGIAFPGHADLKAMPLELICVLMRSILHSLVGMVYDTLIWPSAVYCHAQGIHSQVSVQPIRYGIAYHLARTGIQYGSQVDKSPLDTYVRDICQPHLIYTSYLPSLYQIGINR